ncbi:mitochondrial import receptor subunit TOM7 homolog [Branchiostoma floridae x Branchiostoma japonicum]
MVKMRPETKARVQTVVGIAKTIFHWGYVPFIIYLGFKKGADPGMPEPNLLSILWA